MNTVLAERDLPSAQIIQLVRGDLTEESGGAIVNAANAELMHGAGVAGAILRRGGSVIQQESLAWVREHGPVTHDRPAWTSGGSLSAKYVIHAVGPIWGEGDEEAKLEAAVLGSLRVADELGVASISLPAISTGIFGFPKERAGLVTFGAIRRYFAEQVSLIRLVRVVLFDQATIEAFTAAWARLT
jgi:O-acetyl-ADP-ribose deacetylase (regulator of RNase III)